MKKSGFTLAEILIALTIVGVVAALVAPSLHNLLPNRDKVNFLRVYNGIATVAEEIIEDSDYYYGSSPNGACMGFACDSDVLNKGMLTRANESYAGIAKHQCLISDRLNVDKRANACNPGSQENRFSPISGIVVTMNTVNIQNNYLTNITVDMGDENVYHLYMDNWGKLACGRFIQRDNETITVTIDENDAIAQAYLNNRLKLNHKTEDSQNAEGLAKSFDLTITDYRRQND